MIKGQAKTDYQREYMRKRRSNKLDPVRPVLDPPVRPTLDQLRQLISVKPRSIKPSRPDTKDVLVDESGQSYKLIGGVRYAVR